MNNDERLKANVLAELKWDPRVKGNEVGVIVKDGAVTLAGTTTSCSDRIAVERAVKRVKGVRAIAMDLEVKLPEAMQTTDEGIAEQIGQSFDWHNAFRASDIQAEVRSGEVTLTGHVDWAFIKRMATNMVSEMIGVVGVLNLIRVRTPKSTASPKDIRKQIQGALHRHANVEASKISIEVEDGKVILGGTVDAFFERDLIEDAVWATPGVHEIADHIRVK